MAKPTTAAGWESMSFGISITLEDWLRTGRIGPLAIGDTADDVTRWLGEATYIGPKEWPVFPGYWLYDEVEFGFDERRRIKWIQTDTINIREARAHPAYIAFDWQGVKHQLPLEGCKAWLAEHDLTYHEHLDDDGATLTIEGRTEMLLTDPDDPRLVTIQCPALRGPTPISTPPQ